MTDKLDPALSAEEWAEARAGEDGDAAFTIADRVRFAVEEASLRNAVQLIAFANDDLPVSERRKITRAMINALRVIVNAWDGVGQDAVALARWIESEDDAPEPPSEYFGDRIDGHAILDALESYLPPEQ